MDQFLDPETDTKHQFLDPETVGKCQFLVKRLLDPETDIMDQFLDPETDIKHQFLDPETDKKCQFLDGRPETDVMDQFLDPETDIMGEGNYILSEYIMDSDEGSIPWPALHCKTSKSLSQHQPRQHSLYL